MHVGLRLDIYSVCKTFIIGTEWGVLGLLICHTLHCIVASVLCLIKYTQTNTPCKLIALLGSVSIAQSQCGDELQFLPSSALAHAYRRLIAHQHTWDWCCGQLAWIECKTHNFGRSTISFLQDFKTSLACAISLDICFTSCQKSPADILTTRTRPSKLCKNILEIVQPRTPGIFSCSTNDTVFKHGRQKNLKPENYIPQTCFPCNRWAPSSITHGGMGACQPDIYTRPNLWLELKLSNNSHVRTWKNH